MADDKPRNADFVGRVVSDAKNPPDTQMLTGWFGDSSEEGYRRLYTEAELNNYVDIPDEAILNTEPIRDVQPPGGVFVWIRRDAALKPGGSAASRAARFLRGEVQQDFDTGASGSLEKAGLRCVTEVPCGEPTGFTGQCTKQPEVGGAWPCITAIPHCFEVTGFTGKCTHAPWPNPTRYIGCTYLHCPTNDLTHIPQICNIVASGIPGCVVVDPQQGGDPALKAGADAEERALPATHIPGCGYTKTWGVCETHLLGCGAAAGNAQAAYITSICEPTGFCHVSQHNCGDAAAAQAAAQPASAICATAIGCDITLLCHTRFPAFCFPTPICPTRPQQCFPIPSPFCPVTQACPFGPGGGGDPAQRAGFAAFAAAAPIAAPTPAAPCVSVGGACTSVHGCTVPPTSPDFKCTQSGPACPTNPKTLCTQSGPTCSTSCGADCQSQQLNCTQIGVACGHPLCTQSGPGCPTSNPDVCPSLGIICPVTNPQIRCAAPAGAQAFAAAQMQAAGGIHPTIWTQIGVQCPSHLLGCTQSGPHCLTYPQGDCTFFGCPSRGIDCTVVTCTHVGPLCPNTAATVCTQTGPQCPPHPSLSGQLCPITTGGPQCPPASGFQCPSQLCQSIACQSIACQPGGGEQQAFAARAMGVGPVQPMLTQPVYLCPHPSIPPLHCPPPTLLFGQCNSAVDACPTRLCTIIVQCNPSAVDACPTRFGCPTHNPAACPPASGFNCPSQLGCPSIACGQTAACQPGGGQQAFAAFDQSTDFCPTSMGCGGVAHPQAAIGGQVGVTAWLDCTQFGAYCPPFFTQFEQECVVRPPFTFDPQCQTPPPPTPGCPTTHCPPRSHLFVVCTALGPQCPRTVVEARAAQPAGGVHPQAALGGHTPWFPTPATRCFICPPLGTEAMRPVAAFATGPGYGCTYVGPNCQATQAPGCGSTHHLCTPVCG